ncbi:MAG: caspase family protein [Mariniphaga sp.]
MKKLYLLLLLSLFTGTQALFAQQRKQVSAVSKKVYISVKKEIPQTPEPEISKTLLQPPYLEITNYRFTDDNGNNKIDAGETVKISFDLVNSGMGSGEGLTLVIEEKNKVVGLDFKKPGRLTVLKQGESRHLEIPIEGNLDLADGLASFRILVNEPNGFGTDPLEMEIETQSFRPPVVKLVDFQVSSQVGGILEKRKPFDLEILVQNLGQGMAEDVSVKVDFPANIFCLSANQLENIGKLEPGEQKLLSYNFITNNEYRENTIGFRFEINEKYGKYAEPGDVVLTLNQEVSAEKLVVRGVEEKEVEIAVASLSSDVDKNIPVNPEKLPSKVALIFGNEDYSRTLNAEVNVEYARRDADIFLKYAVNTLGVVKENVYFNIDATSGTMNTEIDRVCELIKRMGPETELIFYYAGHGFPDEKNHAPYLIPVDVNASNLNSAIPLKEVYKKFGETGAKKITVVLDACFSGGGRNQGLLADARGFRIKPKEEELMGNMVVFSASTGEQTALPYHEQKHGMFTYFLLKILQETNGSATFGDLDNYLKAQVGINSLRINGKVQDPVTTVSPQMRQVWKSLTF